MADMTRQHVADRLGVSIATVRRMEGKELHPVVGLDGVRRFESDEVEVLLQARLRQARSPQPEKTRREPAPNMAPVLSVTGEIAAEVFADLDAGRTPAHIVVARKVVPELVRRLVSDWQSLRRLEVALPSAEQRLTHLEERLDGLYEMLLPWEEARIRAEEAAAAEPPPAPSIAELFGGQWASRGK